MTASRWQSLHYIWTVQIVQIQKNTVFCVSPLSTDTDTAICQVSTDVKCNMQLQTVNHIWNGCSGLTEENVHNHHVIVTTKGPSWSLRQLVGEICKTLRWKLPAERGKGLSPFTHGCRPPEQLSPFSQRQRSLRAESWPDALGNSNGHRSQEWEAGRSREMT